MKYIFVHGLGQPPKSWDSVIDNLSQKEDILCPDLSAMLCNQEVTYGNLYRSFSEYCMQSTDPIHLCGLSLGGILALQYAIEHPDHIASLTLIGTQFVMPKTLLKVQNLIFRLMPDKAFQTMGFGKSDFISLSKSMMDLNFQQDLRHIHCPVLIVCGKRDHANKKAALKLAHQIPGAKLSIIENAGHEVNTDAPRQLSHVLNRFYKAGSLSERS